MFSQFIESKTLISNPENIKIYYINLDVYSIGIELFAFSEPGFGLWIFQSEHLVSVGCIFRPLGNNAIDRLKTV